MQNIPNVKPEFRLVPAVSVWDGQEKPQPCPVWSCSTARLSLSPGTDTLLQATALLILLLLCQLAESPTWAPALPAAPWKILPRKIWMPVGPWFQGNPSKRKISIPSPKHMAPAELCNASRSHFSEQVLPTKHNFCMNGNSTERRAAPTWTSPC